MCRRGGAFANVRGEFRGYRGGILSSAFTVGGFIEPRRRRVYRRNEKQHVDGFDRNCRVVGNHRRGRRERDCVYGAKNIRTRRGSVDVVRRTFQRPLFALLRLRAAKKPARRRHHI